MIYLSESALKYAVNICDELPNYKVGIVAPSYKQDKLTEIIDKQESCASKQIRRSHTIKAAEVSFANGSMIKFLRPTKSARGHAFHLVIVNENIDRDFIYRVLLPMEKLDYYKWIEEHSEQNE